MAINVITPDNGSITYSVSDNTVTVIATPDTGYTLDYITVIDSENDSLIELDNSSFELPDHGNVEIYGTFSPIQTENLIDGQHLLFAEFENGLVEFKIEGATVVAAFPGDIIEVEITPFVGYICSEVSGVDIPTDGGTFVMPDSNVEIVATFVKDIYQIICGDGMQTDVSQAHAGDTITAIPVSMVDGVVFYGIIVESEIGVVAQTLDVTLEFEMPAYNVLVRQMTKEESESYVDPTDDSAETGDGEEETIDNSDIVDPDDQGAGEIEPSEDIEPDTSGAPPYVEPDDWGYEPPPPESKGDEGDIPEEIDEDKPVEPEVRYVTITETYGEIIKDYSIAKLAEYEASGATAWALYSDGSEEQVEWSEVSDPRMPTESVMIDLGEILDADNQHFWTRTDNPDGAGAGAFVTDEQKDTFLSAIVDQIQPTDQRPLHNILINAEGIALRAAKYIRAMFASSGVAFFDGKGNAASNIVASFGSDGFSIGSTNESHVIGDYHSLQLMDREGRTYFHISDLRDREGSARIVDVYNLGDYPTDKSFSTVLSIYQCISVKIKGELVPETDYVVNERGISFYEAPGPRDELEITYITKSYDAKAYTFGLRQEPSNIGALSIAEGHFTAASGYASHAEGYFTEATGYVAHAEGIKTKANNYASHAEGYHTEARSFYSHAEGYHTEASGLASHTEGSNAEASGDHSHAEGSNTKASGDYSHAEGYYTEASGSDSHAEGSNTKASGHVSHAEGYYTEARNFYSHAEGIETIASGNDSHAEGYHTEASGSDSHAEGSNTKASGFGSHAEGCNTEASGAYSHAQNSYTRASYDDQTAIGRFNDDSFEGAQNVAFMIGNGVLDNKRSNAFTVDWDGNLVTTGNINLGNDESTSIIKSKTKLSLEINSNKIWDFQTDGILKLPDRGSIQVNASQLTIGETTSQNINPLSVRDSNNIYFAQIRTGMDANKNPYIGLIARRGTSGEGNLVQRGFYIACKPDGTAEYTVHNPENFRQSIGMNVITGEVTINSTNVSSGTIKLRKQGNVVYLTSNTLKLANSLANNSGIQIATIPEGFRPTETAYLLAFYANSVSNNAGGGDFYISITNAGVMTLRNNTGQSLAANINYGLSGTFIIA